MKRWSGRSRNYMNSLIVVLLLLVITYCVYMDVKATSITKRKDTCVHVTRQLTGVTNDWRKAISTVSMTTEVYKDDEPIDTANLTLALVYQLIENDIRPKDVNGHALRGQRLHLKNKDNETHAVTDSSYNKTAGFNVKEDVPSDINKTLTKAVNITKGYNIPEPFSVRPAFIRIYEENELYDKYGLWKVGKGPQNDTLMAVILDSIKEVEGKEVEDGKEMISPPTLSPLPETDTIEAILKFRRNLRRKHLRIRV